MVTRVVIQHAMAKHDMFLYASVKHNFFTKNKHNRKTGRIVTEVTAIGMRKCSNKIDLLYKQQALNLIAIAHT